MSAVQTVNRGLLSHAYGKADDIPALLEQIETFPVEHDWQTEPWSSLWSALYHQGTIYPASLAAIPSIVTALSKAPAKATLSFYLLPVSIAIVDGANPVEVSRSLRGNFASAITTLGEIAATELATLSDDNTAKAARAAVFVSKGAYPQAADLLEADD